MGLAQPKLQGWSPGAITKTEKSGLKLGILRPLSLENLRVLDPNQELFLAEASLKPVPIGHPPFAIDAPYQHFEDNNGILVRSTVVFP
jgi:hypothetical protein